MDPTLAKICVDQYVSPVITTWYELEPTGQIPAVALAVGAVVLAESVVFVVGELMGPGLQSAVVAQRQNNPLTGE